MRSILLLAFLAGLSCSQKPATIQKVFDVHIHGESDQNAQIKKLEANGIYKAALSTSWEAQQSYRSQKTPEILFGLMFPCPNGKVPYSLQPCFENGQEWPSIDWVEEQIKSKKIDFLGEILNQYYGISPSDTLHFPYYAIAEKYQVPVGIHTGGAGPNHGSPNFKMEMGNPALLKGMLQQFPRLKLWIMHGGDFHFQETISIMREYKDVYADISVLTNPDITTPDRFQEIMKAYLNAGLENRIMFGSDNGDIVKSIASLNALTFLTDEQREKIFYKNAERFFAKSVTEK